MSADRSCYKTSNNKYFDCPPRMDDARHFTDYRPSCHVHNLVNANNTVMNSFESRMFLTRNATQLMDLNRTYACEKNCCSCDAAAKQVPEQSVRVCTNQSCNTDFVNQNGVGVGRKYGAEGSCSSWPQAAPFSRPENACAPSGQLYHYYSQVDSKAQGGDVFQRSVTPSQPEPFNF